MMSCYYFLFIEGKVNEKDRNHQTFARIFYHPHIFEQRNNINNRMRRQAEDLFFGNMFNFYGKDVDF
jgi:hypothetical protein